MMTKKITASRESDKLIANRSSDKRIAELLGWEIHFNTEGYITGNSPPNGVTKRLPHYTTSWSACEELVEEFIKENIECKMEINCREYHIISFHFIDGVGWEVSTSAETAPLAICRAFYEWKKAYRGMNYPHFMEWQKEQNRHKEAMRKKVTCND